MAGVELELRKLFQSRAATGHIRAYSYSAIITAGPFALLAGMVLAIQSLFLSFGISEEESRLYVGSVVYAVVFSRLIACGFVLVLSKYVADCLSVEHYDDVTASLFGMSAWLTGIGGLAAALFFWGKPLDGFTKLLGYLFFSQLMILWVQGVYLSAIKKYKRLLLTYGAGVLLSIWLAWVFLMGEWLPPVQGALFAMDVGIGVTVFLFFIQVAHHFGMPKDSMKFAFLPYLDRYGKLFLIAVCYTAGMFLPNIIIWQGPWGEVVEGTYRFAPSYDVVAFYAFLSILPPMIMFAVAVEKSFYERYANYFSYLTYKGNFGEIDDARKDLLHALWFELCHVVEFQFVITLVFLALGNYFLSWVGIAYSQVSMFNVLLFGAFFTGVLQIVHILLVSFGDQQNVLRISLCYFGSNLVLGLAGIFLFSDKGYGFTFFLASAISLVYGLQRLGHFAGRLNYFVFCGQPIFYLPPPGIFTKIARRLYGDRWMDMERKEEPEKK